MHYAELLGAAVLEQHLNSPPGKMLRDISFPMLELLRPAVAEATLPRRGACQGLTSHVPMGALEREVDAKLAAVTADDAEVDLAQWTLSSKTQEESRARVVLRRLVARWWAYYQERNARAWLKTSHAWDPAEADRAGAENCVRRMHETMYWSWPRGSWIFFWKFPPECREDARDGVRFWHLKPPPTLWGP